MLLVDVRFLININLVDVVDLTLVVGCHLLDHGLGALKQTSQVGALRRDLGAYHVGIRVRDLVALCVKLELEGCDRLGDETLDFLDGNHCCNGRVRTLVL